MDSLKKLIRQVPDFPKPGILFYDITTLIKDGTGLHNAIDCLFKTCQKIEIDVVVGIESRGFIFGAAVADRLGVGFVPIRKPGKLPAKTVSASYELEYGTDALEMHEDAVQPGDRVLIVDDLLATGGTAKAVIDLIRQRQGVIAGLSVLIELQSLNGRAKLGDVETFSVLQY